MRTFGVFFVSSSTNEFVYSNNKLYPFSIKLINPIQKYPVTTESYGCTL